MTWKKLTRILAKISRSKRISSVSGEHLSFAPNEVYVAYASICVQNGGSTIDQEDIDTYTYIHIHVNLCKFQPVILAFIACMYVCMYVVYICSHTNKCPFKIAKYPGKEIQVVRIFLDTPIPKHILRIRFFVVAARFTAGLFR